MAWHLAIFDALAHSAVAGFVLLVVASAALFTIRQPARRIRVIEMTLVGLLAVPCLALVPGYPRVAVLPARDAVYANDGEDAEAIGVVAVARDRENLPPSEPGAVESPGEVPSDDPRLPDAPQSLPAVRSGPQPPPARPQRAETVGWQLPRDYRQWIVMGYFSGVGAMFAWSVLGLAAVVRLLHSARSADESCRDMLREVAGSKGARVALLVSSRAKQQCALVWRRPTIVLPANLAAGDRRHLRWALAHEWSHIARGDVWSWGLSTVARWFFFYQPLLWPLRRQLRLCQDFLADATAARAGTAAEDYAEFLTSYSSGVQRPYLVGGLGIAGRASDLRRRIVMLVSNRRALEAAAGRRWNLVALPLAVLLIGAVTSVAGRPATNAGEAREPGSEQNSLPPQAGDSAQAEVGSGATSVARPAPRPSQAAVDMEVEKDPVVQELTREVARLTVQLARALGQSPDETDQGVVKVLQRQILQLEEMIDERRAQLRPKILQWLATAKDAEPRRARRSSRPAPFSGRIRPGDILKLDIAGGFPTRTNPSDTPPTVEPDGNLALGALYGRVKVGGMTLQQAEAAIQQRLKGVLKDPQVQVTYVGHDPDVVATDAAPPPTPDVQTSSAEPLQPLDTVEILIPLKVRVHREIVNGKVGETLTGRMPEFSGTYVIEPNGDVALPHGYGRVNVNGKDVRQAGAAIRDRLSEKMFTRTALPTVHVVKRGRAVFPEGNEPPADYRVRKGDSLLIGSPSHETTFNYKVDADGNIGEKERKLAVEGMTLAEVQDAIGKSWKQSHFPGQEPEFEVPWYVTIGGWREEADPDVIDRVEGNDQTRMQQLERELQEIKDLIRGLNQ